MTKSIIALLTIALLSNTLLAQEIGLMIDRSTENIKNTFRESLLFAKEDDNGKIFVVQKIFKNSSTPKGYHIKRFLGNMEFEERVKIESQSDEIRGMFINETQIFLIQYEYSSEDKAYKINLLSSDKNSLNFKKSNLYTVERNKVDKYDKFGDREKTNYPNVEDYNPGGILVSSENGKYYCYSLRLKKTKSAQNLFLIFDENFKLINSSVFEEKIKGKLLVNEIAITNEGIVYFLSRKYKKNIPVSRIITFVDKHTIRLHRLENGKFNEVDFNNQEFSSGSAYITAASGSVYIFGYFSGEGTSMFKSGGFSGIFRSEIDSKNNRVNQYNKYYFKDFLKNKKGKPVETISNSLAFKNAFVEKGDLIFNSEIYYIGGNNNACVNIENSLSTKFDKYGKLSWIKIINKKQGTCWGKRNIGKYSFVNLYQSEKLYFLTRYDIESKDEINDDESLGNVITMNTLKGTSTQSRLSNKKASEIYYRDEINLSNEAVIMEGIGSFWKPNFTQNHPRQLTLTMYGYKHKAHR